MTTAGQHVKLVELKAEGPGGGIINVELGRFTKRGTGEYFALELSVILTDNSYTLSNVERKSFAGS